jgi:hypothetical protein
MSTPNTQRVREVGPGLLPEPAPRVGAHSYAGKRVRDDAREAVLVMVFSITSALGLAGAVALLVRLAG